jgi:MoxR-like ATPase
MPVASPHIVFRCPKCHKALSVPAEMKGRTVACVCSHKFQVPDKEQLADAGSADNHQPVAPPVKKAGPVPAAAAAPPPPPAEPAAAPPAEPAAPPAEPSPLAHLPADTREAVAVVAAAHRRILAEIGKIIVGQQPVLDQILTAFFAKGHCVLEGVPGLAKTLMVNCLADSMALSFKRVQFTPDLMPTDITGTTILEQDDLGRRSFVFAPGPVFTNILLADEINRTPPKTQAALLEAMQERKVTVQGETHVLPAPFLVLATQNPIEQEGTYPLPEAQLDRFLFLVKVGYPSEHEEEKILLSTTLESLPVLRRVMTGPVILACQELVRRVPVSPYVANYAARLVRATRPGEPGAPDFIKKWVRWGCGPRAGQSLLLAAKAHVVLAGKFNVSCGDVRTFAHPTLRHRLGLNFAAVSEGYDTDKIVDLLLAAVPEEKKK